jgi:hypothetical protein
MSSKPGLDKKTEVTFKTIDGLKASNPAFQEFIKAATNYQKALLSIIPNKLTNSNHLFPFRTE